MATLHSNTEVTATKYTIFGLLILVYFIFTIFIAVRFPVANNILISLLLAILVTPIFWIIKIVEIVVLLVTNKN
jgi:hypothetical protein